MSTTLRRFLAIIMAIFSAVSLVATIFLIYQIWNSGSRLEDQIVSGIDNTQKAVNTASRGLVATQLVMTDTQNILQSTVEMMLSISASLHEVPPVLKELEDLSGTSLPQTIENTKVSIVAAQDSAGRIEDMLALLSQIPFFPGGKYEPEVTLKDALGLVGDDLSGFTKPLENMQDSLKSTRENLEGVEVEGVEVAVDLRKVAVDLKTAGQGLDASLEQIEALDKQLQLLEDRIPGWITSTTWVLTFILGWVGLAQIGWLIYAISLT
jgi:hypothetical protein